MSIILRMQNLPWSASSADIRKFFVGVSIPDGGVHIVGGELGDVFIAFSTDEDARRAFGMTNKPLCGTKVTLMLSSKNEMMEVITTSRAAAQKDVVPSAAPSAAAAPAPTAAAAAVPDQQPSAAGYGYRESNDAGRQPSMSAPASRPMVADYGYGGYQYGGGSQQYGEQPYGAQPYGAQPYGSRQATEPSAGAGGSNYNLPAASQGYPGRMEQPSGSGQPRDPYAAGGEQQGRMERPSDLGQQRDPYATRGQHPGRMEQPSGSGQQRDPYAAGGEHSGRMERSSGSGQPRDPYAAGGDHSSRREQPSGSGQPQDPYAVGGEALGGQPAPGRSAEPQEEPPRGDRSRMERDPGERHDRQRGSRWDVDPYDQAALRYRESRPYDQHENRDRSRDRDDSRDRGHRRDPERDRDVVDRQQNRGYDERSRRERSSSRQSSHSSSVQVVDPALEAVKQATSDTASNPDSPLDRNNRKAPLLDSPMSVPENYPGTKPQASRFDQPDQPYPYNRDGSQGWQQNLDRQGPSVGLTAAGAPGLDPDVQKQNGRGSRWGPPKDASDPNLGKPSDIPGSGAAQYQMDSVPRAEQSSRRPDDVGGRQPFHQEPMPNEPLEADKYKAERERPHDRQPPWFRGDRDQDRGQYDMHRGSPFERNDRDRPYDRRDDNMRPPFDRLDNRGPRDANQSRSLLGDQPHDIPGPGDNMRPSFDRLDNREPHEANRSRSLLGDQPHDVPGPSRREPLLGTPDVPAEPAHNRPKSLLDMPDIKPTKDFPADGDFQDKPASFGAPPPDKPLDASDYDRQRSQPSGRSGLLGDKPSGTDRFPFDREDPNRRYDDDDRYRARDDRGRDDDFRNNRDNRFHDDRSFGYQRESGPLYDQRNRGLLMPPEGGRFGEPAAPQGGFDPGHPPKKDSPDDDFISMAWPPTEDQDDSNGNSAQQPPLLGNAPNMPHGGMDEHDRGMEGSRFDRFGSDSMGRHGGPMDRDNYFGQDNHDRRDPFDMERPDQGPRFGMDRSGLPYEDRFGQPRDMDRQGPPRDMDRRGPTDHMDRRGPSYDMDRRGPSDMNRMGPQYGMDSSGPSLDMDRRGPPADMDRRGPPTEMDRWGPPRNGDRRGQPEEWNRWGPPQDMDRHGNLPQDMDRRGPPPHDMDRRGPPPHDMDRRGPHPSDMDMDRRGPPPHDMNRRGPSPQNVDKLGPSPHDMDSRGPPPHDMDGRGPPPHDMDSRGPRPIAMDGRGPPPHDKDRRGPPPHDMGGRGPPPHDMDRRGPPPHDMDRRGPPPHDMGGRDQPPHDMGGRDQPPHDMDRRGPIQDRRVPHAGSPFDVNRQGPLPHDMDRRGPPPQAVEAHSGAPPVGPGTQGALPTAAAQVLPTAAAKVLPGGPPSGSDKPKLSTDTKEKGDASYVKVTGLHFRVTSKDIVEFFAGVNIAPDGIKLGKNNQDQLNGEGFIKLSSKKDYTEALKKTRQYMGRRFIVVYQSTEEEWRTTGQPAQESRPHEASPHGRSRSPKSRGKSPSRRGRSPPKSSSRNHSPRSRSRGHSPQRSRGSSPGRSSRGYSGRSGRRSRSRSRSPVKDSTTCLELKGLPSDVKEKDILDFFRGVPLVPNSIFIECGDDGKGKGNAYARLVNQRDMRVALNRDGRSIGRKRINVHDIATNVMQAKVGEIQRVARLASLKDKKSQQESKPSSAKKPQDSPQQKAPTKEVSKPKNDSSQKATATKPVVDSAKKTTQVPPKQEQKPATQTQKPVTQTQKPVTQTQKPATQTQKSATQPKPLMGTPPAAQQLPHTGPKQQQQSPLQQTPKQQQGLLPLPNIPPLQQQQQQQPQAQENPSPVSGNGKPPGPQVNDDVNARSCVHVRNLPYHATENEILHFFRDLDIVPPGLVFMLNPDGSPSGQAYMALANQMEAVKAGERRQGLVRGRKIVISLVPKYAMLQATGMGHTIPNLPERSGVQGPPGPGPQGQGNEIIPEGPGHQGPGPQRQGMGGPSGDPGARGTPPGTPAASQPRPNGNQSTPARQPLIPESPQSPDGRHPIPLPPLAVLIEQKRIVEATNLPFDLSVGGVVELFQKFNVIPESVRFKNGPGGRPTGAAIAAFVTPQDAEKAIDAVANSIVTGRTGSSRFVKCHYLSADRL
ncbi:uncharacterized protein [Amphiura filiformis]|uniref:uncharacterized protein n=1 Tax=Amphiura filiformis TaxID=82378 RepID=UPI003B218AA3